MTKIKLCGLSRPSDIEAVNVVKPDYIGFVFFRGSKRYVPPEHALFLRKKMDPAIRAVGVFVNEDPAVIRQLHADGIIDVAQLHGQEPDADIHMLQEAGIPVIRAFPVHTAADVEAAVKSPADFILLDSGSGSGETFDWQILDGVKRPYFLAGGLGPGNVAEAVSRLHPFAVDVSSGIETGGEKDPRKMQEFINQVKAGDLL